MTSRRRYATEDPFSFLFVRLDAKTRDDMFYLRFEKRLLPKDSDASSQPDSDGGPLGRNSGVGKQVREGGPSPGPHLGDLSKHQSRDDKLAWTLESGRCYGMRQQFYQMYQRRLLNRQTVKTQEMW